jgi:hypothetical protein
LLFWFRQRQEYRQHPNQEGNIRFEHYLELFQEQAHLFAVEDFLFHQEKLVGFVS